MAKKSRTPAPPRKVQAPQRRSTPKRRGALRDRRGTLIATGLAALGVIAAIAAAVIVFTGGNGASGSGVPQNDQLVGLQTGPAPWNPGLDTLPDRLKPLGLHDLTNEGEVVHIHQHLDIYVNGKHEPVPANIGIYDGQFLTELHTHDASGITHVESPTKRQFDLGEFFGVWGVRMDGNCIGGYCKGTTPWAVYVDGRLSAGDPAAIQLEKHQEIAIVIGKPPKKIPTRYAFPPGV